MLVDGAWFTAAEIDLGNGSDIRIGAATAEERRRWTAPERNPHRFAHRYPTLLHDLDVSRTECTFGVDVGGAEPFSFIEARRSIRIAPMTKRPGRGLARAEPSVAPWAPEQFQDIFSILQIVSPLPIRRGATAATPDSRVFVEFSDVWNDEPGSCIAHIDELIGPEEYWEEQDRRSLSQAATRRLVQGVQRVARALRLNPTSLTVVPPSGAGSARTKKLWRAIQWFDRATLETDPLFKVVSYVIALEALVLGGESEAGRKSNFGARLGVLLGDTDEQRSATQEFGDRLYEMRNDAVHGSVLSLGSPATRAKADGRDPWERVSFGMGEAYEWLIRPLARAAILSGLALIARAADADFCEELKKGFVAIGGAPKRSNSADVPFAYLSSYSKTDGHPATHRVVEQHTAEFVRSEIRAWWSELATCVRLPPRTLVLALRDPESQMVRYRFEDEIRAEWKAEA